MPRLVGLFICPISEEQGNLVAPQSWVGVESRSTFDSQLKANGQKTAKRLSAPCRVCDSLFLRGEIRIIKSKVVLSMRRRVCLFVCHLSMKALSTCSRRPVLGSPTRPQRKERRWEKRNEGWRKEEGLPAFARIASSFHHKWGVHLWPHRNLGNHMLHAGSLFLVTPLRLPWDTVG